MKEWNGIWWTRRGDGDSKNTNTAPTSYGSLGNSTSRSKLTIVVDGRKGNDNDSFVSTVRYRECQNFEIRILIPPSCFCVVVVVCCTNQIRLCWWWNPDPNSSWLWWDYVLLCWLIYEFVSLRLSDFEIYGFWKKKKRWRLKKEFDFLSLIFLGLKVWRWMEGGEDWEMEKVYCVVFSFLA